MIEDIKTDEARVVTMRELSQDTSRVINGLLEARRPAALSKRGRLVAMIIPLEPGLVESVALSRLSAAADSAIRSSSPDDSFLFTVDEAAKALGVEPPELT